MKNIFKKLCGFLLAATVLASPLSISASEDCCKGFIKKKDVAGTYQFSGFSNSSTPAIGVPQSDAIVGKLTLNCNGTGVLEFVDYVTRESGGTLDPIHRTGVPFTYTLGPINGQGTIILPNFPSPGDLLTFAVSFKSHKCRVTGFSALTTSSTINGGQWTLIQAERFN